MQRICSALLRLYPAKFQAVFAAEILQTLQQSHGNRPREVAGLAVGALREHWAAIRRPSAYLGCSNDFDATLGNAATAGDLQALIRRSIQAMEFAIAHHDFPGARLHCQQERLARQRLAQMLIGV